MSDPTELYPQSYADHVRAALCRYLDDMSGQSNCNAYQVFIEETERVLIEEILRQTEGNQTQAADRLGMSRNTLRKKIQKIQRN